MVKDLSEIVSGWGEATGNLPGSKTLQDFWMDEEFPAHLGCDHKTALKCAGAASNSFELLSYGEIGSDVPRGTAVRLEVNFEMRAAV